MSWERSFYDQGVKAMLGDAVPMLTSMTCSVALVTLETRAEEQPPPPDPIGRVTARQVDLERATIERWRNGGTS